MIQSLVIRPTSVMLWGQDLLLLHGASLFREAFGPPSRSREIKMHPSGVRVAMVWDNLGLVAYEDRPEGFMSHLHLAFDPSATPERPSHASSVAIDVNGAAVSGDATERTLPKDGATPILASFGRRYYFEAERYVLDFAFEKRRDTQGRKFGTPRLAFVSVSWR